MQAILRAALIAGASTIVVQPLLANEAPASAAPEQPALPALTAALDNEIVVTGEKQGYVAIASAGLKTDTPLIDTPQTVSVVTEEQISDQALQDIGDVLRYTPGVSVGQGEGNRDQITIRGQNTTADFFLDGVRDDVQYFRPLYNLDRVEIHKGPNALIFGRGGGGGSINRVTKTPVAGDSFGEFAAGIDTFGAYQLTADGNIAIGENAALRINALAEGFNNHRDVFDGERYAINPTIAANLGERTQVLFSYEYVDDDRVVDRGVPAEAGGVLGNPAAPVSGFDRTFFGDPDANVTTLQAHIVRGRLFHELSDSFRFNATVHYADYDKLYGNIFPIGSDLANGIVGLEGYLDTTQRQNFIAQANFLADLTTGPLAHELLFGFEYADQQSDNDRRNARFAASGTDRISFAFTDPLIIPAFTFPVFNRDTSSQADVLSFYVQDQISIGSFVQLIGGVRFDRFAIDVVDQIEVSDGAADGNSGIFRRVDEEFSPRVGLIIKPRENISLYASYALSFLPRSGDQFLTLTPSAATLAPEQFENYEIGVKWDVRDGLSLTAALFRLDRENGTTVDPANVQNSILTGSRTDGIELQLVGKLTSAWQINAAYSYLDGEELGRVAGGVLANRVLSQVPRHHASLWSRYDFSESLGIGAGVTHQSSQFASISNAVRVPGYTRFDAAVYYRVNDAVQLQLNVENLFDTDYFVSAHNDNNISPGEPLNARLSVRFAF